MVSLHIEVMAEVDHCHSQVRQVWQLFMHQDSHQERWDHKYRVSFEGDGPQRQCQLVNVGCGPDFTEGSQIWDFESVLWGRSCQDVVKQKCGWVGEMLAALENKQCIQASWMQWRGAIIKEVVAKAHTVG
jgi:hypothetical protein